MNAVWRSLLWKEWREQRWTLTLLGAGCLLIPLGFLVGFREWDAALAGLFFMLCFGVPATAMFVGAGIAARERSQRTVGFLQSLPSSMKKAAAAKLIVACATVIAPSALTCIALAIALVSRPVEPFQQELQAFAMASLLSGAAAVSLLIWTAATGVNHVDELRAGAIGLATTAVVWAAIALAISLLEATYETRVPIAIQRGIEVVVAGAPGGIFAGIEHLHDRRFFGQSWQNWWPLALAFLSSHGTLAAWYIVRLGRRANPQAATGSQPTAKPVSQWLSPPRHSRTAAIAWKQFRESAPLAALGGLAVLIVSPVVARATSTIAHVDFIENWQLVTLSVWLMAGVFVAVVAGIGLFYDDLRPTLHTFWRSRPIDVDAWFWTKLLTGLTVTILALAAGPVLTFAAVKLAGQATPDLSKEPTLAQVIGGGLIVHSATFVLAALAIVLVRQPVIAAMLTFGVWVALAVSIGAWFDDAPRLPVRSLVIVGLAGVAGLTILTWQAQRRDWGWAAAD